MGQRTFKFRETWILRHIRGEEGVNLRMIEEAFDISTDTRGKKLYLISGDQESLNKASSLVNRMKQTVKRHGSLSPEVMTRYLNEAERKVRSSGRCRVQAKTEGQQIYLDAIDDFDLVLGLGPAGTGKAQPLTSRVLTPSGWVQMGNLSVGDVVCTPDGDAAKINGVFPQGPKEVFRVWFTDGSYADCCKDHLWLTQTCLDRDAGRPGTVKSLEEIRETLKYRGCKRNHSIPMTAPVKGFEGTLPVDPYVLGLLLGDGCFRGQSPGFSSGDPELVSELNSKVASFGLEVKPTSGYDYRISGERTGGVQPNGLKDLLETLGLWGCKSEDKFIPSEYLFSMPSSREALLQGLMDSDGTIEENGECITFTTTSPRLSVDFQHLVQSLGGTAKTKSRVTSYTYGGDLRYGKESYRTTVVLPNEVSVFRLERKKARRVPRTKYFLRRYMDRIESLDIQECQCISVDHPDHLYITDHYVVTHNTFLAVAKALQAVQEGEVNRIVIARPAVEAGEKLGFLPGDLEDKVGPYMRPIYDSMQDLMGDAGKIDFFKRKGLLEVAPLAFMRGRTLSNSFVILDEAQNCTISQIKMLLTRLGEGTRCVVTGDENQTDLRRGIMSGLTYARNALQEVDEVCIVQLDPSDIVRHELVGRILEAFDEYDRSGV